MTRLPIREQLVSDLADGDQEQRKSVCAYDRMRGLAYASDLARAIKRMQVEANSATINITVIALNEALTQWSPRARAMDPTDRGRICLLAVLQRVFPRCTECDGRGSIYDHGKLVVQCEGCGGSGLRRFNHKDWRRVFRRAMTPWDEEVLDLALTVYSHHDSLGEEVVLSMIYRDEDD